MANNIIAMALVKRKINEQRSEIFAQTVVCISKLVNGKPLQQHEENLAKISFTCPKVELSLRSFILFSFSLIDDKIATLVLIGL